ncbi:hypothetical protein [Nocardia sp. NPDC006630]|uniref:hypothetical protein n=1 Tax=Nocardia sp. NPDC006630 TaxID=3157181 RepID=UPI0033B863FA
MVITYDGSPSTDRAGAPHPEKLTWFSSRLNYLLSRAEYFAAFAVCLVLFFIHITEVRWLPALILFAYIDLVGYIPGLIVFKRSAGKPIPAVFHHLYNGTHNFVSAGIVAGLWAWLIRPEWALLMLPLHLLADRGLLGNFAKPAGEIFE